MHKRLTNAQIALEPKPDILCRCVRSRSDLVFLLALCQYYAKDSNIGEHWPHTSGEAFLYLMLLQNPISRVIPLLYEVLGSIQVNKE